MLCKANAIVELYSLFEPNGWQQQRQQQQQMGHNKNRFYNSIIFSNFFVCWLNKFLSNWKMKVLPIYLICKKCLLGPKWRRQLRGPLFVTKIVINLQGSEDVMPGSLHKKRIHFEKYIWESLIAVGYSFQVPWSMIALQRSRDTDIVEIWKCHEPNNLLIPQGKHKRCLHI